MSDLTWEVYPAKDGWRWRLVARNGRIIADSGEAYVTVGNAQRAVDTLIAELGAEQATSDTWGQVEP